MTENFGPLDEAIATIDGAIDRPENQKLLIASMSEIHPSPSALPAFERSLDLLEKIDSSEDRRVILTKFLDLIPTEEYYLDFYTRTMHALVAAAEATGLVTSKKSTLLTIASLIPRHAIFDSLYRFAMQRAIIAANELDDHFLRRHSLSNIANDLIKEGDFIDLRLMAMELALGLSDEKVNRPNTLPTIANELPKSCDYEFYRKSSFLGVTERLPKTEAFKPLYERAMTTAIEASGKIKEPFYKRYALSFLASELLGNEELLSTYDKVLELTYDASMEIRDGMTQLFALTELLEETPKEPKYHDLLLRVLENILETFSVRNKLGDVEVIDVIDFIIVAEERKMTDSKKLRYSKENYAHMLAASLKKFGHKLNDIRFIHVLKPYTHVWVRPTNLRDSIREVVARIEELRSRFHGKEILQPILVHEVHSSGQGPHLSRVEGVRPPLKETIAIDLGATNTVVMRKSADKAPNFVPLKKLTRKFGTVETVPTLFSPTTGEIGTKALESEPVTEMKKLLLDGNARGKEYMEKYFSSLYRSIQESIGTGGWLKRFSGGGVEMVYLTVPVGFQVYRDAIKGIVSSTCKGVDSELIDEPLAAAIGYQVAEEKDKVVMVVDFGGCTLDVMVVRLNVDAVHVIAKPDRSAMLGGKDIDDWVERYLAESCDIELGGETHGELNAKAEELKIALSEHREAGFRWQDTERMKLTLEAFEKILEDHDFYNVVDRTVSFVLKKAAKIGVPREKIEALLLTGGSSQIPSFKEKLGDLFPALRKANAIYDYSPLTAVASGAALYGTNEVTDRHLAMAYALRYYKSDEGDGTLSYELALEKGETLPFEKTFKITPAKMLGDQREIFLELFEVPDLALTRRWERDKETGLEYIMQVLKHPLEVELKPLKVVQISFKEPIKEEIRLTLCVDEGGSLTVRNEDDGKETDSKLKLQ